MHWLDTIRTCWSGFVLRILNSIHQGCPPVWGSDSPVVKKDRITTWARRPIFAPPTSVSLTGRGRGILCSLPRLRGGGGDRDSELLTTPPAQRVVHTAKVFTAHKCRSKLIHSGNTEKKALTDCLMCWHSYKLLDKKSNTFPLFQPIQHPKLLPREHRSCVWEAECHPAGEDGPFWGWWLGVREEGGPWFWGDAGVLSLSRSLSGNWLRW